MTILMMDHSCTSKPKKIWAWKRGDLRCLEQNLEIKDFTSQNGELACIGGMVLCFFFRNSDMCCGKKRMGGLPDVTV